MSKTTIILLVLVLAFLFLRSSSSTPARAPYVRDPWAQPPPAPNYGAGPPPSPTTSSVLTTLITTAGQAYHDYLGSSSGDGGDDYEDFANSLP